MTRNYCYICINMDRGRFTTKASESGEGIPRGIVSLTSLGEFKKRLRDSHEHCIRYSSI